MSGRTNDRFGRGPLGVKPTTRVIAAAVGLLVMVLPGQAAFASGSKGPVDVLAAGSLVDVGNLLGPAFDKATGYQYVGDYGGSTGDITEIKGKTVKEDVFISTAPWGGLEGAANGDWVSWYAELGTTPLVIGYNPKSKFAHDLKTMAWYKVAAMPGFKLGRTDPAIDPKGVLADEALSQAAKLYNEHALAAMETSQSEVYPEQTLVGRLEAGQLDAGFFYGVEATAAKIPTVSLGAIQLSAEYTISILNKAQHTAGAEAFLSWLFSSAAAPYLKQEGITPLEPTPIFIANGELPSALNELVLLGAVAH